MMFVTQILLQAPVQSLDDWWCAETEHDRLSPRFFRDVNALKVRIGEALGIPRGPSMGGGVETELEGNTIEEMIVRMTAFLSMACDTLAHVRAVETILDGV
jgi:hypothetical protein